jgi:hypothetical protein
MATYLQGYGIEDERRGRIVKRFVLAGVAVLIVALAAYLFFRDFTEKQAVNRFLEQINAHDYKGAYNNWCTAASPCPNYSYSRFLEDWGPDKKVASPWSIASVESCKSFVTVNVQAQGAELQSLGVQRSSGTLGFAPAPECQEIQWHWKAFFQRILGRG